jgi:formylglycine-generating enzyme required for sulfatase activity
MLAKIVVITAGIISLTAVGGVAGSMPQEQSFTNSLGMEFVRIEPGEFMMAGLSKDMRGKLGSEGFMRNGDPDEQPAHKVKISKPFYMGTYEVTNSQYEKFDPSHRLVRGKLGFSIENDEAVVFVSWDCLTVCLPKPSGNMPVERELRRFFIPAILCRVSLIKTWG